MRHKNCIARREIADYKQYKIVGFYSFHQSHKALWGDNNVEDNKFKLIILQGNLRSLIRY